jgi:CO/xanthine dehydrogenase Mo-binding subunit
VAIGIKSPRPGTVSQAIVRIHADSSATVLVGTVDMGQGSRTILRQLAADALGLDPDAIQVRCADTALVPFDSVTASSRSTVFMGNAVLDACAKVRDRLRAIAAEEYGAAEAAVTVAEGAVQVGGRKRSYGRVIQDHYGPGAGEVVGVGEYRQKVDGRHPLDGAAPFWEVICFGAEVEVDEETGRYRIVRFVTTGDIGKALNPAQLRGQDEGGALMGLGHTMMEHLVLDNRGRIAGAGPLDYRIPTIQDVPDEALSLLVENADGPGPYGAKGTGESGVLAVSPAVVSALSEATGLRFTDLPVTPERVWEALQARAREAPTAGAPPHPNDESKRE